MSCQHEGLFRITTYTAADGVRHRMVECETCGESWDGPADRADDHKAVSRVMLGLAAVSCALGGLALFHGDRSAAFAFGLVGLGLVILSTAIRRRWIA